MDFDISSLTTRTKGIEEWLQKEFASIRTGQASPALIEHVQVSAYGALVPINQIASVGVEDARTLRISPWDGGQSAAIEKAIVDANLGLSVVGDSSGLRVIFPELTSERRQEFVKLAKQRFEEARVSVRAARDETMKAVEAAEKKGELSEDEKFRVKEQVQKVVDSANGALEKLFMEKEKNIITL